MGVRKSVRVLCDYKIIYFKERKLKFELLKSVLFINVYQRIYSCVKGFFFLFVCPEPSFLPLLLYYKVTLQALPCRILF